jgi:hypothetical protein
VPSKGTMDASVPQCSAVQLAGYNRGLLWLIESVLTIQIDNKQQTNSVASVRERTIPTERPPLVGEVSSNLADRGCHVVSVMDLYGLILSFLDRSRYFFFRVAPQLYSRG